MPIAIENDFSRLASTQYVSIVDVFFPGLMGILTALWQYYNGALDICPRLLVYFGTLLFCFKFVFKKGVGFVNAYFVSKMEVQEPNEAYTMLESWLSDKKFANNSRSLLAQVRKNRGGGLVKWDIATIGKKPILFLPWQETFFFWYKRHLLMLQREEKVRSSSSFNPFNSSFKTMNVSCFGFSSKILKDLLNECRREYLELAKDKTTVFKHKRGHWEISVAHHTRPINTVVMDEKLKQMLVDDIQSFLRPETRHLLTSRGLPYRKGYLFYGHPGTGKSSLCYSIAGHFGLDIYLVSLSTLDDDQLDSLFLDLPESCIVLLEDIDATGGMRTHDTGVDNPDAGSETSLLSPKSRKNASLSGLLNTLDGVSAQQGRIVIMTTNYINRLDKALIRPGRVDKAIEFQLADFDMATKLFCLVFEDLEIGTQNSKRQIETKTEVQSLAEKFAAQIPALELTPADILSFILGNKESPHAAEANVGEWVSQKQNGTKL